MSPSKRAGDTVEPDVDPAVDTGVPAAERAPGHRRSSGTNGASPARAKRRSTTAAASTTPTPERGSSSQRGASSSSITRRSVTGTAPAAPNGDGAEPVIAEPDESPAVLPSPVVEHAAPLVESPIALPPAPSTDRVDAPEDRPAEAAVVVPPLPVLVPANPPAPREAQSTPVTTTGDQSAPPEPPYVTTTMSSHQVAPVPRLVGRRPRVRKVTRVVRHVDPWSVFKVALVFNIVLFAVLLTAGVLLWNVAYATGTIDNLERFFESFGWSEFEFDGGAIYHSGWIAGLFGVVGLTGAAVLGATLFNLITDLVGGIRMTVLEEEVVERTSSPMRRFVVRRPAAGYDPGSEMQTEGSNLPARQDPVDDPFR